MSENRPSSQSSDAPRAVPMSANRTLLGIPAVRLDPPPQNAAPAPTLPSGSNPGVQNELSASLSALALSKTVADQRPPRLPTAATGAALPAAAPAASAPASANSYDLTAPMPVSTVSTDPPPRDVYSVAHEPSTGAARVLQLHKRFPAALKLAVAVPFVVAAGWVVATTSMGKSAAGKAPPPPAQIAQARSAPAAAAPASHAKVAPQEQQQVAPDGDELGGDARRAGQLVNQGNAFKRKKMYPLARSRYLEALKARPGYPRALAGLTQVSLASNNAAQAVIYARQLTKGRPTQASYQLLLGDAERAAGHEQEARVAYEAAARQGSKAAKQRLAK